MGTTIKFRANTYRPQNLIRGFKRAIKGVPGFYFTRAEIRQDSVKDKAPLTLYAKNGFDISVVGPRCGTKNGYKIVNLLKHCGFTLDDATIFTILNCDKMNITLYK